LVQERSAVYGQTPAADEDAERRIEDALHSAFKPFRCLVEFQDRRSRITVTIYGHDQRPYVVTGKSVDSLLDPDALARYVRDLRYILRQRGLMFDLLQP
jgi:hypothetical protein